MVRVTDLFSERYGVEPRITKEEQERFLTFSLRRAGADSLITPREILRDYLTVLNILLQNENARFDDVAAAVSAPEKETAESTVSPNAADPDDLIL